MKSDAIAFGVAGILFGLIAGWIIGSQQTPVRPAAAPAQAASAAPPPSGAASAAQPAAVLDETKVNAFKAVVDRDPKNVEARVQLGNLYFDAERYDDAIKWYGDAFNLAPNDVNVSTDLGVSYYYTNQSDRALDQFSKSLKIDPKHAKTLLNVGIVKAFGKQDLEGALQAWQQVIQASPDSPEGQAAKRALDSLRSAHPNSGAPKPGA
jgi:tetratricopeptide (TPR) repeat protein